MQGFEVFHHTSQYNCQNLDAVVVKGPSIKYVRGGGGGGGGGLVKSRSHMRMQGGGGQ